MRPLLSLLLISLGSVSHAEDRIIEVASGHEISRAQLLAQAHQSDFLLLGEIHDNPHHHFRRAELITALAPKAIHAEARIDVVGANISRDLARRIVREGNAALPARLAAALTANPLSPSAEVALDADLLDSHCGQLPATRLPRMRLAQRARDASMARGVTSLPVRPAILVAGNGHVRSDYGVPALLARLRPGARIINIAFEEEGKATDAGAAYTHIWTTPAVHRDDPCKGFSQARP